MNCRPQSYADENYRVLCRRLEVSPEPASQLARKGQWVKKMNQKFASGLRVAKSRIDGKGCFAVVEFRQHQRIAEYIGERITFSEAPQTARAGQEMCCDIDQDGPLMAVAVATALNTSIIVRAQRQSVVAQGAFFCTRSREIEAGEEITAEYLYELRLTRNMSCQTAACVKNDRSAQAPLMQIGQRAVGSNMEHPKLRIDWRLLRE